jgi:flavin reductase (DIM6/NTAB) family NADH-FMN oxidoreductase RutF
MTIATLDPTSLRRAFAAFPTGVTAVCALSDGQPVGIAASSFTSVSLEPPLVSVAIAHDSRTWPLLRAADRLGVSVLADEHGATCRALASSSPDRFTGIRWSSGEGEAVFIDDSCLTLNCSIEAEVPAGDHDVILLRVHSTESFDRREPLVFHESRFRKLVD